MTVSKCAISVVGLGVVWLSLSAPPAGTPVRNS